MIEIRGNYLDTYPLHERGEEPGDFVAQPGGFGDRFLHRTGHSIDTNMHGDGANLDYFETHDTRLLAQGAGFSIEPGVYLKCE